MQMKGEYGEDQRMLWIVLKLVNGSISERHESLHLIEFELIWIQLN